MRVGVLHGTNVLIVHHVFRPDNSVQILEVGASIPWHACALGKAIVAFLPEPSRRALLGLELAPLTGRTVTDPAVLEEVLAAVAAEGTALEDEEAIVGEAEIAAPVFDDRGHSVGRDRRRRPGGTAPARGAAGRRGGRGGARDFARALPRHGRRTRRRASGATRR